MQHVRKLFLIPLTLVRDSHSWSSRPISKQGFLIVIIFQNNEVSTTSPLGF